MADEAIQTFSCPGCKARYRWHPEHAGKRVQCKKCGAQLQIPTEASRQATLVGAKKPTPAAAPTVAAAPQPAKVAGDELRFVADTEVAGGVCPSCSAPLATGATVCAHCGLDLVTGLKAEGFVPPSEPAAAPGAGTGRSVWNRAEERARKPFYLADVLKGAFSRDMSAEALILMLGWLGWSVAVGAAAGLLIGSNRGGWQLGQIAGWVLTIGAVVAAVGWLAKTLIAVAEQHESGALMAQTDRSRLGSLGLFLAVGVVAGAPAALLMWLGAAVKLPVVGAVLGWAVWTLYWPMGVAMASAYGTLNPLAVVKRIAATFPAYILVLIFYAPLVIVAGVANEVLQAQLSRVLPDHGYIADLAGGVAGTTVGFYALVCLFAMLGMLLRRFKRPDRLTFREAAVGMAWAAGALAVGLLVLVVRSSSLWASIAPAAPPRPAIVAPAPKAEKAPTPEKAPKPRKKARKPPL